MDQNPTNPYTTEIPVSEAEKELHHTTPVAPASSPIPTPPPQHTEKTKSPVTMLATGLLIITSFLAGYIVRGYMSSSSPAPVIAQITPTTTPTRAPTPTSSIQPLNPMSNRFSSTDLGIVFDTAKVLPDSNGTTVLTQIDGSRVYVYTSGTQANAGQYVDVFSKVSTDTTVMAAEKITVNDSQFQGCTFEVQAQTVYPPSYERVVPNCPDQQGGGMRYFLTDSLHPTRLLYFSIGQYGIPASDNPQLMWQDTLRFL